MILEVKFNSESAKNVYKDGNELKYATIHSSGFDLRAVTVIDVENSNQVISLEMKSFVLKAHSRCLIQAGISTKFPDHFEMQIRPRSGLALKNGITIVNSPGTIDSDYRGEIGIILLNTSNCDFEIKYGDRIAQAVISPVERAEFQFVAELNDTIRSSSGFGSSGSN